MKAFSTLAPSKCIEMAVPRISTQYGFPGVVALANQKGIKLGKVALYQCSFNLATLIYGLQVPEFPRLAMEIWDMNYTY